jgi:hypothetical protein
MERRRLVRGEFFILSFSFLFFDRPGNAGMQTDSAPGLFHRRPSTISAPFFSLSNNDTGFSHNSQEEKTRGSGRRGRKKSRMRSKTKIVSVSMICQQIRHILCF